MSSKSVVAFIAISLAIHIAGGGAARAAAFADCAGDAADRYLVAQTEFQRQMRDLVVAARPEFAALATVNMELQTLLAEARRAMIGHLLEHDAGRIDTTSGLGQFTNFDWSDGDTEKLVAESNSYGELRNRIALLREQNKSHPDWPKMREYFASELRPSPEFKAVMAGFQTRQSEVEAMIAQCRRD